jgi:hypothetical protein
VSDDAANTDQPVTPPPAEAAAAPPEAAAQVPEEPKVAPTAEAPPVQDSLIGSTVKDEEAPPASSKDFTLEPFTVPEGITLAEDQLKELQTILVEASPTKEVAQATGQKLVDLFVKEVQQLEAAQQRQWEDTNAEWVKAVKADPEIGGNRIDTALRNCASVIETFGGTKEQKAEIREALKITGAGNHPAMVRLFNRIGEALGEGQPKPAPTPTPKPQTRAQRRYNSATA